MRALDSAHEVPAAENLRAVQVDLSSAAAIDASVGEMGQASIDILVNNAGVFEGGLLEQQSVEKIYDLLQSTLTGPIHLTRRLLPGMLERGRGKIVNNASVIGHAPFPGAAVYAAAKTGLHGFTESLRRELADTGLTVLELVTPGVDTDMMQQVQEQLSPYTKTDNWDHNAPEDWAGKVVEAIRDDDDELKPGGAERLAQLLPKPLLDLTAGRGFSRT